ncbi:MAG: HAD-IA family hydrolase [Phycisphaerales bacterium]|nr:HAD-IA family hydrolase [Phycisphaerales bacterium]
MLFDIDGTLLSSMRAGVQALTSAGRACIHEHFSLEGIEVGGRLDGQIIAEAFKRLDVAIDKLAVLRQTYERHLAHLLQSDHRVELLPGVSGLLDAIEARIGWTLGLLTGNFSGSGQLKLRAAGIDPSRFAVQAWAEDGPSRNHLPHIAMQRCTNSVPGQTVIIGDTLHDISCARACGCRVIAVATGVCSRDTLACGQPDLLLDDLSDTGTVMAWLERMSA